MWWGGAAIGVLALLFLAAGFCCLDQDGMDPHGMSIDLCAMAIGIIFVNLTAGTLVLLGLAPTAGRPWVATILLAVPKPPPRRARIS